MLLKGIYVKKVDLSYTINSNLIICFNKIYKLSTLIWEIYIYMSQKVMIKDLFQEIGVLKSKFTLCTKQKILL